jgi:hypothetical protein
MNMVLGASIVTANVVLPIYGALLVHGSHWTLAVCRVITAGRDLTTSSPAQVPVVVTGRGH